MRLLLAAALVALPLAAQADEVTDAIDEARGAYEEGDLAYAKETLDYAAQLIARQRVEQLTASPPQPLDGWTMEEAESDAAAGLAIFGGGGVAASRVYQSPDRKSAKITVMLDSPLVAQMGMMLSNPTMLSQMGEVFRIGRQQAVLTSDGDVQMMINNRALVQIEGTAAPEDMKAYAQAIDIRGIADF